MLDILRSFNGRGCQTPCCACACAAMAAASSSSVAVGRHLRLFVGGTVPSSDRWLLGRLALCDILCTLHLSYVVSCAGAGGTSPHNLETTSNENCAKKTRRGEKEKACTNGEIDRAQRLKDRHVRNRETRRSSLVSWLKYQYPHALWHVSLCSIIHNNMHTYYIAISLISPSAVFRSQV